MFVQVFVTFIWKLSDINICCHIERYFNNSLFIRLQTNTKRSCQSVPTWDEPQTKATKYKISPPSSVGTAHYVHTQQWRSNFYFIVNLPFVSGPLCCQTIQTSYLWWENVLRLVLLYCPSLQWNRCNIQYHFPTELNISPNIIPTICEEGMIGELKLLFCLLAVAQSSPVLYNR